MTYEEALEILEKRNVIYTDAKGGDAIRIAINALEKQLPRKPKIITTHEKTGLQKIICPLCHKFLGEKIRGNAMLFHCHYPNFCECCGQALDWRRE